MHSSIAPNPKSLDPFEILMGDILPLQSEHYTQAIEVSDQAEPAHQWQVYLNQLASGAVTTWLQEWLQDLIILSGSDPYKITTRGSNLDTICWLQVGELQWCLLVTESFIDGQVVLPTALLEQPEWAAHFYVAVEIWEAAQIASIRGFLTYNQLQETRQDHSSLCYLPLERFESSTHALLRDQQLIDAAAFGLPVPPSIPQQVSKQVNGALVNVALWLQDTLDDVAQDLGWSTPTPLSFAYASGWRSADPFAAAIATLLEHGMTIPPETRGTHKTFTLVDQPLQLMIATWPFPSTHPTSDNTPSAEPATPTGEWSLLILLGTPSGTFLPPGVQLQVRDQTQLLSKQTLDTDDLYLVAHVIGEPEDQLDVTITLAEQSHCLESFIFAPLPQTIPSLN